MTQLAIVIPALNESATIAKVVRSALAQSPQVIVVDDGSTDDTAAQLEAIGDVTVIRHAQRRGKGASLADGLRRAFADGADVALTMDADDQHQAADVQRLLAVHCQHPDALVMGARLRNRDCAPSDRKKSNEVADFWVSWAAGRALIDTQSGFRLFPKAVFEAVSVSERAWRSFVFESEMLVELGRAGVPIISVPIDARYLPGARASHFRPVLDIVRITLMIAGKLISRAAFVPGLLRAQRGQPNVIDPDLETHDRAA